MRKKTEELNLTNISSYPRIVMLGTGCSVPSKVRNTSGILLRIDENTSILLDCGEGTLGQIIRFYGFSESDNIFTYYQGSLCVSYARGSSFRSHWLIGQTKTDHR